MDNPICRPAQHAAALRRPYNEWGKEGKFASRRYPVGALRRDRQSESFEGLVSAQGRPVVPAKPNLLKSSELAKG
jgi:hypothetical protein